MTKKLNISKDVTNDHYLKYNEATVKDVIKYVTSPTFCQVPWDSVTMSVGKGQNANSTDKKSIVHIHRASTGKRNIFDIKFHNCQNKKCEHNMCSKKCFKPNLITSKQINETKSEEQIKNHENTTNKPISSGNLASVYNQLIEKVKLSPSRKSGKSLTTNSSDSQDKNYCDKFNSLLKKLASLQSDKDINNDILNMSQKSKDNDFITKNNKKNKNVKRKYQNNDEKPSCTLQINNNGCNKALHFDLHPALEVFLLRAINKIEEKKKEIIEKEGKNQKTKIENRNLNEKEKFEIRDYTYYKSSECDEENVSEDESQANEAKYSSDESNYSSESSKKLTKNPGHCSKCEHNKLSDSSGKVSDESSKTSKLRSSLASSNSTKDTTSEKKKSVHFSDESKDTTIDISDEMEYEKSSDANNSKETERSASENISISTIIDKKNCRIQTENNSSSRIVNEISGTSRSENEGTTSRSENEGTTSRSENEGTTSRSENEETTSRSENERNTSRSENEGTKSSRSENIGTTSRSEIERTTSRSENYGTTSRSENEGTKSSRSENRVTSNNTENENSISRCCNESCKLTSIIENELSSSNSNVNQTRSNSDEYRSRRSSNETTTSSDFERSQSNRSETYKSTKSDNKTYISTRSENDISVKSDTGVRSGILTRMANKESTSSKSEFDLKPVKEKDISGSSLSIGRAIHSVELKEKSNATLTRCNDKQTFVKDDGKYLSENKQVLNNNSEKIFRPLNESKNNNSFSDYKLENKLIMNNYIPPFTVKPEITKDDFSEIGYTSSYSRQSNMYSGSSLYCRKYFNPDITYERNININSLISQDCTNPVSKHEICSNCNSRHFIDKTDTRYRNNNYDCPPVKFNEENISYNKWNKYDVFKNIQKKTSGRIGPFSYKTTPSNFYIEEDFSKFNNERNMKNRFNNLYFERGDMATSQFLSNNQYSMVDGSKSRCFSESPTYYSSISDLLNHETLPIFRKKHLQNKFSNRESENFDSSSFLDMYNSDIDKKTNMITKKSILKGKENYFQNDVFNKKERSRKMYHRVHFVESKENLKFNFIDNYGKSLAQFSGINENQKNPFCQTGVLSYLNTFNKNKVHGLLSQQDKLDQSEGDQTNNSYDFGFLANRPSHLQESTRFSNSPIYLNNDNKEFKIDINNQSTFDDDIRSEKTSANIYEVSSQSHRQTELEKDYVCFCKCLKCQENYSNISLSNDNKIILQESDKSSISNNYLNKEELQEQEEEIDDNDIEDNDEGQLEEENESEENVNQRKNQVESENEEETQNKDCYQNRKINKRMYTYGVNSNEEIDSSLKASSVSVKSNIGRCLNYSEVRSTCDDSETSLSDLSFFEIQDCFESEASLSDSDLSRNWMTEKANKKEIKKKKVIKKKQKQYKIYDDMNIEIPPFLINELGNQSPLSRTMAESKDELGSNSNHILKEITYRENMAFNNNLFKLNENDKIFNPSKSESVNKLNNNESKILVTKNFKNIIPILPMKLPSIEIEHSNPLNIRSNDYFEAFHRDWEKTITTGANADEVCREVSVVKKSSELFVIKKFKETDFNQFGSGQWLERRSSDLFINKETNMEIITGRKIEINKQNINIRKEKFKKRSEDTINRDNTSSHPLRYSEKKKYIKEVLKKTEDLRKRGHKYFQTEPRFIGDYEKTERVHYKDKNESKSKVVLRSTEDPLETGPKVEGKPRERKNRDRHPRRNMTYQRECLQLAERRGSSIDICKSKSDNVNCDTNGWFQDPTLNPQSGFSPNICHL